MKHLSVLLQESIESLDIRTDKIYVDATLGRAGHSLEIVKLIDTGHLYSIDKDQQAIDECLALQKDYQNKWTLIKGEFSNMDILLSKEGIAKVDGILMDIGVSSPQFDDETRGFSYRFDSRLDMRMDQTQELSAYEIVNTYTHQQLSGIIYHYGEEKFAKKIADEILRRRDIKPIETTFELVDIIKTALPHKELNKKGHPAKKTFQALRIEVNHELDYLKDAIIKGLELLNVGGRLSIITFHSLEDRIVKKMFQEVTEVKIDKRIPYTNEQLPQAKFALVNKKPIIASEEELLVNNRAHSAKLRTIIRRSE